MTWVITLVTGGLSLLGSFLTGINDQKSKKLEIQAFEVQERWRLEFQKWEQEERERILKMEQGDIEHKVKLFDKAIAIIERIARTNIELAILAQQANDQRYMLLHDWHLKKKQELEALKDRMLANLQVHLENSERLSTQNAERFAVYAISNYEKTFDSISKIESKVRKQIAIKCKEVGVVYTPIAGSDAKNLLLSEKHQSLNTK